MFFARELIQLFYVRFYLQMGINLTSGLLWTEKLNPVCYKNICFTLGETGDLTEPIDFHPQRRPVTTLCRSNSISWVTDNSDLPEERYATMLISLQLPYRHRAVQESLSKCCSVPIVRCFVVFRYFPCLSLVPIVFRFFSHSPWHQKTDNILEKPRKFCLCSTFGCFLSEKKWYARSVLIASVSGKRKLLTWRDSQNKKHTKNI